MYRSKRADIIKNRALYTAKAEPEKGLQIRKRGKAMAGQTNCESCANYVYDEESDCYCCEVDLDEDEMYRFLSDTFYQCPYYQLDDEYRIVRKQM